MNFRIWENIKSLELLSDEGLVVSLHDPMVIGLNTLADACFPSKVVVVKIEQKKHQAYVIASQPAMAAEYYKRNTPIFLKNFCRDLSFQNPLI